MPKASPILQSYNAGELSPYVRGRTDLAKYFSGCELVENMLILPEGPLTSRPGTYFVAELADSDVKGRVMHFNFSTIQGYILEFGENVIQFYKDFGQILDGASAYQVTTTYLEEDLFQLQFAQSADVMYIFHPKHPMRTLSRTGHTSWTLAAVDVYDAAATNITAITKAANAVVTSASHGLVTGDVIKIASVVGMTEINGQYTPVTKIDANSFSCDRIDSTGYTGYSSGGTARKMLAPSCGTFFEQRLAVAGMETDPQSVRLSKTADFDYFTTGTADDDAMNYSIVSEKVDRILWMISETSLICGTVGGVWKLKGSGDDPITPTSVDAKRQNTLGNLDINAILTASSVLCVRRGGRVVTEIGYQLESDKWEGANLNLLSRHITKDGIKCIAYQQEPANILWCVRGDGQLLAMTYEKAQNVIGWTRIVTDGEVESVAVLSQNDAEDQVWITVKRTIDGVDKRYVEYFKPIDFGDEIEDAFFVDCGLTWDGEDPLTDIESITRDNPAVVTHTADHGLEDGDLIQFTGVEGMTELNCGPTKAYTVANKTDKTYELSGIDSTLYAAYTGGGTVTHVQKDFTGADHLEGEDVAVLADGAEVSGISIESGGFSLDYYVNKVHVGLPYYPLMKTMDIEAGAADGTAQGKTKKISKVTIRFYNTCGAKVGFDEDYMDTVGKVATVPFGTGTAPALFTGNKSVNFPKGFGDEAKIVITQRSPLPITIISIMPKMTANG